MNDVLRLLDDMSALNKSSHLTKSLVSISELFSSVETSFRPLMKEHDIHFLVFINESLQNCQIPADALKLKEALTNLLLNAIDAVSEVATCHSGEILLTAEEEASQLSIHVRDNGPGIPAEYLDTLFTPFVTHKPHGTGLGLSIVQNIARQHGGSLTMETQTASGEASDTSCAQDRLSTDHTRPDRTEQPIRSYTDFCLRIPLEIRC
jgi:signal transduction histidine kinase